MTIDTRSPFSHSHAFGQDRKGRGENRTFIVIAVTAVMTQAIKMIMTTNMTMWVIATGMVTTPTCDPPICAYWPMP